MPKPPQFTPDTWRDQQRMLAEGQHTEDLGTAVFLRRRGGGAGSLCHSIRESKSYCSRTMASAS